MPGNAPKCSCDGVVDNTSQHVAVCPFGRSGTGDVSRFNTVRRIRHSEWAEDAVLSKRFERLLVHHFHHRGEEMESQITVQELSVTHGLNTGLDDQVHVFIPGAPSVWKREPCGKTTCVKQQLPWRHAAKWIVRRDGQPAPERFPQMHPPFFERLHEEGGCYYGLRQRGPVVDRIRGGGFFERKDRPVSEREFDKRFFASADNKDSPGHFSIGDGACAHGTQVFQTCCTHHLTNAHAANAPNAVHAQFTWLLLRNPFLVAAGVSQCSGNSVSTPQILQR